jgi:transposase-like protein
MTSRTNGHAEGQNRAAEATPLFSDLESRRQEAIQRYLGGEPIEQICQTMRCSKSWLYKWKNRYQATEPDWLRARSRRPVTLASKTPEAVEADIVRLHRALSTPDRQTVSARQIHEYLRQHDGASIPSIRTIYRILNRHRKEVNSHSVRS